MYFHIATIAGKTIRLLSAAMDQEVLLAHGEMVPDYYVVDLTSVKIHTRRQRTPDGEWDGYSEWPNPDGSNSCVSYYTIRLP